MTRIRPHTTEVAYFLSRNSRISAEADRSQVDILIDGEEAFVINLVDDPEYAKRLADAINGAAEPVTTASSVLADGDSSGAAVQPPKARPKGCARNWRYGCTARRCIYPDCCEELPPPENRGAGVTSADRAVTTASSAEAAE